MGARIAPSVVLRRRAVRTYGPTIGFLVIASLTDNEQRRS